MRSTLLLLLASLGLACQQNDTPVAIDELRDKWLDTWCGTLVRCSMVTNRQACDENWQHGNFFEQAHLSVQAGRAHYDGEAAATCLARLKSSECTDTALGRIVLGGVCDEIFTGKVPAGGACYDSADCVGGAYCQADDEACDPRFSCCQGTCDAPPTIAQLGESCAGTAYCADDLDCDVATQTCKMPQTASNAPCEYSTECKAPMVCVLDAAGENGHCLRRPATNEACDPKRDFDDQCEYISDHCDPATQRCVRRPNLNEACTVIECPGSSCETQEPCVGFSRCIDGVCQAAPNAGIGQACDDREGPECMPGLDCIEGQCILIAPPSCP